MRYRVLATDYDGTLATESTVVQATWDALDRFKASGGLAILVTGRELGELLQVCPGIDRFDRVVLENGGLLYRPSDRTTKELGPSPPAGFVEALRTKGVGPISVGRVVVATWEPHRGAIEETIRSMGLDLVVIPNKRALMILPRGIDKASGLLEALAELGVTPEEVVAIGDAENDASLLGACGLGVAVANALPALKSIADLMTEGSRGAGVVELIGRMLDGSLASEKFGEEIRE